MKILIQTMHMSQSIGASLQACALGRKLKEMGHEPWLLYYILPTYTDISQKRKPVHSAREILSNCINGRFHEQNRLRFLDFKQKFHPPVTRKYTSVAELSADPPDFDAYICGSDQIWNPNITKFDPSYFFSFVTNGAPKISYAASIGCDEITPKMEAFLKNGLANLDAIGVREDSALKIVRSYCPDKKIVQNIDPTFLLNAKQWAAMESKPCGKLPPHYCLYYPLGNFELGNAILKEAKQKYGLPCVSFNGSIRKGEGVDVNLHGIGPGEFLYLCSHADLVLTNSFHGFALSVNYQKKVICFTKPGQNTRMKSLASLLHLNDLLVSDLSQVRARDWESAWKNGSKTALPIIEREQDRADAYLRGVLKV